jgi:hypothetical protein
LQRLVVQKKVVIHRDTWHTNLPPKNVGKSFDFDTPKALIHQLVASMDDFNDHKHKFEPRIIRGSLILEIGHTKHGSNKKAISK